MKSSCAIIIPAIKVNDELRICLKACNRIKNINIKIYVITDFKSSEKFNKTEILSFGKITMSKKRNLAVNLSKFEYIAFLDSDAYPSKNWLKNAITILKKDNSIGLVTGPDFPFKNQKGIRDLIGLAHKSIFLSGSKTFRKKIEKAKITIQASSCNMVMKKKIFLKAKGMDPKIYVGEDVDFCNRINKFSKILYSPKVKIYHKSRSFIPFLAQRYVYGTCIFDVFKKNFKFSNLQYFIPLVFSLIILIVPFYAFIEFKINILILASIFLIPFLLNSSMISKNPFKILVLAIITFMGVLFFGLGSLSKILFFNNNIRKIYTYR